jgi:hypothetical protein
MDADKIERDNLLGEDTWELFQTIEDSFGIELGDYQAYLGMTVRELAEQVSKKANYPDREACLSAASFYKLRRAFSTLFDIPRTSIRPATPLSQLLPWKRRKADWKLLQENLGLILPDLAFPGWVFFLYVISPAACLLCLRTYLAFPLHTSMIAWGSITLIFPALWALSPLARAFRRGTETFGDLAKVVLARNYSTFAKRYGSRSEIDVLSALQQLIACEMSMTVDEIPSYTIIPQGLNIY